MKGELIYTPRIVNWSLGIVGLLIVGFSTHWNLVPLLGTIIAGLHISIPAEVPSGE